MSLQTEMISKEFYLSLRKQFIDYTNQFKSNDFFVQKHFRVKQEHSLRVCENIVEIGKRIGLTDEQLIVAETIALLHDIGRFEQYKQYGTFSDNNSVNHAELGVAVINQLGLLNELEASVRQLICKTIINHNLPSLHPENNEDIVLYSKLIRDADKLDIFKVVIDYNKENISFEPEEPKGYTISDNILNCFNHRHIVDIMDAKGKFDFFLLRISWIFDINFPATCQLIDQRNYISYLFSKLPKSYRLINIQNIVKEHMVNRIFSFA